MSAGAALAQQAQAPAPARAALSGGATSVGELVVTAQKKSENIQSVPISVTAFSGKALQAQKIEGGPDLLKGVPNTSFTKTNFSGYDLTIRGIGTEAVSVTTDPGVSVNLNDMPLIRNRLFEQEFFDIDRVEVLRGPQGTLYGRNATGGAVNVITAKPTATFGGEIKAEYGNYDSRRVSGFVNLPIIGDKLDLRIAGAWTKRDGYEFNSITGHNIDGRDLWSGRVTLGFRPSEKIHGYLVWEHFNENDSRERSGKQLCTRDPGPTSVGGVTNLSPLASAFMSQGCADASLYSPSAFGTPNGLSIPFVLAGVQNTQTIGIDPKTFNSINLLKPIDPYGGEMQSPNLREIASIFDPKYRAKADVVELIVNWDISDHLQLTSETDLDWDNYFSSEDYNRFNTVPGVFNSSAGLLNSDLSGPAPNITPGGVYCDPQLGCSNTIAGLDESKATSFQFSQEFRLSSSFKGPFNFSLGADYTYYHTDEDYFVFFNIISALAQSTGPVGNSSANLSRCITPNGNIATVSPTSNVGCVYIDPNPLASVNGLGHNYFRSQNPYKLESEAIFGEVYYNITPTLKLTGGLRFTRDIKTFTPIPSQVLLSSADGGTVDGGYPTLENIKQYFPALTGRLAIDWTPTIPFTTKTLLYASYNRGYKAGGANPPGIGYSTQPFLPGLPPLVQLFSYPATFKPETVDAFEVGAKNALMGGALIFNLGAFFYNYKNYQVSQIEDRTAINENFNAEVWGAEMETIWQPTRHLRINATVGYEGSRLANGSQSIDVEDRTQDNPAYALLKANEFIPSNCVVSTAFIAKIIQYDRSNGLSDDANLGEICPGSILSLALPFQPTAADLPNGGRGFFANVSGHSLPNAPPWTFSIGAQYDLEFAGGWRSTFRVDYYHQAGSWARVYEDPIDRLEGWSNVNLRLTVAPPSGRLEFEIYVKNLLNQTAITGAFINSDDTALTTNVFTTDPRLIGASLTVRW
ncbi:MAG TPA: TonB-dependent receptor [Caulobacteraceae bacterium]|nr:TonB-dependent receptor [Caulobacteraceae bacterium]